ncbi:hypothetical protein J5N97_008794 [Dioscorea zingiberensis]|uniref:Uncharacterized protein n=1 Tax=Dioscorea zingiberensis TaxID=325984 RepID=A0A9D5HL33_9LILI|nr:hypothetical protein J5N97_008794 [Dioscorea zingiberensis]
MGMAQTWGAAEAGAGRASAAEASAGRGGAAEGWRRPWGATGAGAGRGGAAGGFLSRTSHDRGSGERRRRGSKRRGGGAAGSDSMAAQQTCRSKRALTVHEPSNSSAIIRTAVMSFPSAADGAPQP